MAEAAEYLRVKPQRVYDLVNQGRLPGERDGERVLVREVMLGRYLLAGR